MEKHKKSLLILALLLVVAVSMLYIGTTYSKYTAEVSGNGTATVAKWSFEDDNEITTIDINLDETYDESTLVEGKIAPGTSGSFAIELNNENSEVGVDFEVALGSITDKPTNLKFYEDSSYTTEIVPGTDTITGQLEAEDATGLTVNIYWAWEYETANGDDEDTADGEAAATLTIPVTITGEQVEPSTTAITSHID